MKTTYLFVLALLLAVVSCKKDDQKDEPVKETPKDRYLIKTAVHTALPYIDSTIFSYNDKYQLKHIRFSAEAGSSFFGSNILTYDDKGRFIYSTGFGKDENTPNSYDSVAWVGQKATRYIRMVSGYADTSRFEYNSTGQQVSLDRGFIYNEYTYQNGDLLKLTSAQSSGTDVYKYEEIYEYDSMPNPFYDMYLNNPFIDAISTNTAHKMLPSKHNITKSTRTDRSDGVPPSSFSQAYINKYNATTGLLEEQINEYIGSTGAIARSSTKFTYIKVP